MTLAPLAVSALPPPRPAVLSAQLALSALVSGRLSVRTSDRIAYSRDAWALSTVWMHRGMLPPPPDAVVWPDDEAQVCDVIQFAREQKLAVVPFGGGSGVYGGVVATRGGLALDLKRLETIAPVDPVRRCVDVGAGVNGEVLERRLAARGWTLGHAPGSLAMSTVGGWLATRSAGHFASRYGKIEDMVLSVRGVFGTGEAFQTAERPGAGPDLTQLLLGSEGTLCVFTGARLRVHPRPRGRAFRGFRVPSWRHGLELVRGLLREGLRPALIRLTDPLDETPELPALLKPRLGGLVERLARSATSVPRLVGLAQRVASRCRLLLMFEGEPGHVDAEANAAARQALSGGAEDLGEGPAREWFHARGDEVFPPREVLEAGLFVDQLQVAAPWSVVPDVVERVRAATASLAVTRVRVSQAWPDGCQLGFFFTGGVPGDAVETEARYVALWRAALGAAASAGANVAHHQGIGLLKSQAFQDALGDGRATLALLKRSFDPDGILNPGKLGL